jgi:lipopolysaccharide transport system ATP-binding protein
VTTAPAIELRDVSKRFRLRGGPQATTLKSTIVDLVRGRRTAPPAEFAALRHVDLVIEPGRMLGVIGRNGSGKSTLLKLIAGIYRPDSGAVRVNGRVAALIELGAGFHPEFTGRENILVNGMLLGLPRREVLRRLDEIVAFAELSAFIDQPARTYSSGMYVRLGFAVAVHLDPAILLIDEVLAVGDEAFARKCADRIAEFRRLGKTMVLVTHDPLAVERWCDEALWLDQGVVRALGTPRKVIDEYHQALAARESEVLAAVYEQAAGDGAQRWGGRQVEIERVKLLDGHGRERYVFEPGEPVTVSLRYRVHQAMPTVVFGFAVLRADGLWVYGTNTEIAGVSLPPLGAAGAVEIAIDRVDLIGGTYFLDVAVQGADGTAYDYHSRRYRFSMGATSRDLGVVPLRHEWRVRPD